MRTLWQELGPEKTFLTRIPSSAESRCGPQRFLPPIIGLPKGWHNIEMIIVVLIDISMVLLSVKQGAQFIPMLLWLWLWQGYWFCVYSIQGIPSYGYPLNRVKNKDQRLAKWTLVPSGVLNPRLSHLQSSVNHSTMSDKRQMEKVHICMLIAYFDYLDWSLNLSDHFLKPMKTIIIM